MTYLAIVRQECRTSYNFLSNAQIYVAAYYKNTAGRSPDIPTAPRKKAFYLRNCFEFLQKVFSGLMYSFSCVLWAIFRPVSLLFFVR